MTTKTKKRLAAEDSNIPTLQQRREMIELVACDGLTAFADDPQGAVTYVLQAICVELLALSISVEQEVQPAMKVGGAMLGGLFGIDSTATDPVIVRMHQEAKRLRAHVARQIGLPVPGQTLYEDEEIAEERRVEQRKVNARLDAGIERLKGINAAEKAAKRKPRKA